MPMYCNESIPLSAEAPERKRHIDDYNPSTLTPHAHVTLNSLFLYVCTCLCTEEILLPADVDSKYCVDTDGPMIRK